MQTAIHTQTITSVTLEIYDRLTLNERQSENSERTNERGTEESAMLTKQFLKLTEISQLNQKWLKSFVTMDINKQVFSYFVFRIMFNRFI